LNKKLKKFETLGIAYFPKPQATPASLAVIPYIDFQKKKNL